MPLTLRARIIRFNSVFWSVFAVFAAWAHAGGDYDRQIAQFAGEVRQAPVGWFGDSHLQTSLLPVPGFAVNAASASEMYLFTLQKIRLSRPRVVVLGYWQHNLMRYYDAGGLTELALEWMPLLPGFTPAMSREVSRDLTFEQRLYLAVRQAAPCIDRRLWKSVYSWRGGYDGSQAAQVDDRLLEGRYRGVFEAHGGERSAAQYHYVRELLAECGRRNIPVVLLSTPVHPGLLARIPSEVNRDFAQLTAALLRPPHVRYWDCSTWPAPAGGFRDADHLNDTGARAFTPYIVRRLLQERVVPAEELPSLFTGEYAMNAAGEC